MVVHRKDASGARRMVTNHGSMIEALRVMAREQGADVKEFVGNQNSIPKSIQRFAEADVVVAPHGAALAFVAFMRKGAAVVEIGYVVGGGGGQTANYGAQERHPGTRPNNIDAHHHHLARAQPEEPRVPGQSPPPPPPTPPTRYDAKKGMPFPAPYYMAISISVDVRYYLSIAKGGYGTPLVADVRDVVRVTTLALEGEEEEGGSRA